MYLKKIELLGFKSFADKVVLQFHPGITAIVGPNGCGKSNISDAFRWVLGEQSPKSMRGQKMHDVIFAGTSKRKPLNFAEVTITLTEVEGSLPTDYEEVSVARRLYRDGESDYLLNRRSARLKDVYSLFMDSGMGKNAFSIFEQGKIDQVINLPPLERRYIFEEAAGILRFLQRKREALRKLEQTEQNIVRVMDIHQEVERQIIILEEQAEKARVYKENQANLEKLEMGLFLAKWDHLQKRRETSRQREEGKRIEVEEVNRSLEKLERERQAASEELEEVQKDFQAQREAVFKTRSNKEIKTKEYLASEERLHERIAKEKQWLHVLDEMIDKRRARQLEIEETLKQQQKVGKELSGLDAIRASQREKLLAREVEVNKSRNCQHEAQRELLNLLQIENQLQSEIKQTTLRLEHSHERKARILEHIETLGKHIEELSEEVDRKKGAIEVTVQRMDSQKEHVTALEKQNEQYTEQIRKTQEQLDTIYQERAEYKARQNVLLRLRDEMEGFSSGTKRLLQESASHDSPLHNKVRGLYESLLAESGTELAVSVVMRPYTQTLVVETTEDFQSVVKFAQEHHLKDFSLLCLEYLASEEKKPECDEETLLENITDNAIARHFLKNVYIKEDAEEGLSYIHQCPGKEVWTEEGIYIDRHRVVFFTSEGENNIFLREAELKTLGEKLEESEVKRSQQEANLKVGVQLRAQIQAEKDEVGKQLRQEEMKLVEEKFTLKRLEADFEKTKRAREKEQEEVLLLDNATTELDTGMAELNHKHAAAKNRAQEVQQLVDTLNEQLEKHVAALKLEQKEMQDKELAYRQMADEKGKLVHQLNVFEVKDLESLQQEKRLEEEIKSIREDQSRLKLSQIKYQQEIEGVEKSLVEALDRSAELEKSVALGREAITQIEQGLIQKRSVLKQLDGELYAFGIQRAEIDSSRQTLEKELEERFHRTIEELREKEVVLEKSMEKTEREIRALRRKMESAGDINMTSIGEFDKYKERYDFLNQQIQDLTIAKNELGDIITQLDTESRRIFKETFEKTRENFKKNFQILFTGGEADLKFTETGDILETGIEIVAKPPGKQMRSINLLSGGEKCLTALALLFAIFEVKPAPFCILDEIDAPLDDANVDRFVNIVRKFTDKCQFIIITHNKRTMAVADILFGVSMQEKGVSKILSLEFSHDATPEPALV